MFRFSRSCVVFLSMVGASLAIWAGAAEDVPLYKNTQAGIEDRVTDLLSRLTLEEKVDLCYGNFVSGGIPRLGIGQLKMLDGRQGLRPVNELKGTRTTLLPCVLSLSCTWDRAAASQFGAVLAEELLAIDHHVLLAPMLNLVRSPLGGRNFENFGEDPFLVGQMGAAYIRGVQEKGVGACACLLVANDCEHRRHFTSSFMDERTLRELHLAPYEASVREANVCAMMTGNNLYNGVHCAHNKYLLQDLMKDKIGFDGVMITDWRAAYDTVPAALAGTDMTTGFCSYVFGNGRLLEAVKAGQVPMALLEDKARRVLRLYFRSGVVDAGLRQKGQLDSPAHRHAARALAAQSMVLLKNEHQALPIDPATVRRILVTGPGTATLLQGGGSGSVPAAVEISPLQGMQNAFGRDRIIHVPFNVQLTPAIEASSVEWEQTPKKKKKRVSQRPVGSTNTSVEEITRAARDVDAVLFVAAGWRASEGRDLPNMELPGKQGEAIAALCKANSRVIVALVNNGAVTLDPWLSRVQALLAIHYSGQATGDALADVLTGKVNPSGKLSYTFGRRLQDFPAHALGQWPARLVLEKDPVNPGMKPEERKAIHAFSTDYKEGIFAGYRWFDEKKVEPVFPFGFGLSYTKFELRNLSVEKPKQGARVSCEVKNVGQRAGAEVVQIYVAPPSSSVPRPVRELKGFARVELQPGESRWVSVSLGASAFAFYDVNSRKWKTDAGTYELQAGNSSRDLVLKALFKVRED